MGKKRVFGTGKAAYSFTNECIYIYEWTNPSSLHTNRGKILGVVYRVKQLPKRQTKGKERERYPRHYGV